MKDLKSYYVFDTCAYEFKIFLEDKNCPKCGSKKITAMIHTDNAGYQKKKLYKE